VAGVYEENDGNRVERVNPVTGARDGVSPYVKTKGVRASLRLDPTDNLSFNASYLKSVRDALQYDQVESANIANPAIGVSPVLVRASDRLAVEAAPRRFSQDFDVFNWQGEFRFAGQRLNYVGSYNKQRYVTADPIDKGGFFLTTPVNFFTSFPPGVPLSGLFPNYAGLTNNTTTMSTQETHELRLSSDERLFGMFDYVLGGMILKTNTSTNIRTNTPLFNLFNLVNPQIPAGVVLPTLLNTSGTQRPGGTDEKSVFFNLTAHLGERTEISGGLRYIHFTETAALLVDQAGTGVFVDQPIGRRPRPGEQPEENVIWSASAKHRFTDNFMAYFSFGTSWRPGSTTNAIVAQFARVPLVSPLTQFINIPGEKSQSYEIGFKSDWLGRRLKFNATAFLQNFENYAYQAANIVAATGPTSVATLTPGLTAGVPVQVKGIEAELAWNTPRFSAGVSVTYTDSNIKNGVIPCNAGTPVPGDIFPLCTVNYSASNLAPFSATAQAEYNVPISGHADGYVRGLATIFGDAENNPANPYDRVSAYALVNLYAGIRDPDGAWDVGLFVKNLFDVERVTSRNENAYAPAYQNFLGTTGASFYRGVTMTPPREFGLNVRYAFGSR
jgi:iron complex outermembrane receptor protein